MKPSTGRSALARARFFRICWTAEEGANLHLERVARALAHEAAEQEGVDVTLHDRSATERHFWRGEGPLQVGPWIAERLAVEWRSLQKVKASATAWPRRPARPTRCR